MFLLYGVVESLAFWPSYSLYYSLFQNSKRTFILNIFIECHIYRLFLISGQTSANFIIAYVQKF